MNKNAKNIISVFSIEFIARLAAFFSVTYLARVLGTSDFGVINIGLAVLSYAIVISGGGLTLFGIKKVSADADSTAEITGEIVLARIFLSVVIFIFFSVIVYFFVSPKELANVIIAYLFYLFPAAVLLEWFFQGVQSMTAVVYGRAAGSIIYFIFLLLFVTSRSDTVLSGIGWTIGGIANSLLLIYILFKKNFLIKISLKNFAFSRIIKESLPLGMAAILAQLVIMFPVIYLGIISETTASGIFSAAYKLIVLLLILDRAFNTLFYPKIVRYFRINTEPAKSEEKLNTILKIVSLIGLSVSLAALVSADFLITSIFGRSFSQSAVVFQVLIGNFLLTLLNSVFTYTLIAMNEEKIYTISLVGGTAAFFVSIPFLTEGYGSAGAAGSLVLFELTNMIIMYSKLKKKINIQFIRSILIPAGFSLIIFALLVFLNFFFLLKLFLAAAAAICLVFIIGIKKKEFEFVKKAFI